jgi:probable HAF family extracellular repeat protein
MRFKSLTYLFASILFAAAAVPTQLAAQAAPAEGRLPSHYRVINLGTLGGTYSSGNTINNAGVAMGNANVTGDTAGHATVWVYGLKFDLGTLGGANSTIYWPNRNDFGKFAGISEVANLDPLGEQFSCPVFFPLTGHSCAAFLTQWGVMSQLPTLGGNNSIGAGINNQGVVVGWAENNVQDPTCTHPNQVLQFRAVAWGPNPDQIQELVPLPGDPDSAATAINDAGQAVGISGICSIAIGGYSAEQMVVWENGNPHKIPDLGGKGWNTPVVINRFGQVAGFSDRPGDVVGGVLGFNAHAFFWTRDHQTQDLGVLPVPGDNTSQATGMNDFGQVIGVSFPSSHAFLWQNNKMEDLTNLVGISNNLMLVSTGDINDRGEITGQACVVSGGVCGSELVAVLLLPDCDVDGSEAPASAIAPENVNAAVSEVVREQVARRLGLGGFALRSSAPR